MVNLRSGRLTGEDAAFIVQTARASGRDAVTYWVKITFANEVNAHGEICCSKFLASIAPFEEFIAEGDTQESALEDAVLKLDSVLEDYLEQGWEVPAPIERGEVDGYLEAWEEALQLEDTEGRCELKGPATYVPAFVQLKNGKVEITEWFDEQMEEWHVRRREIF